MSVHHDADRQRWVVPLARGWTAADPPVQDAGGGRVVRRGHPRLQGRQLGVEPVADSAAATMATGSPPGPAHGARCPTRVALRGARLCMDGLRPPYADHHVSGVSIPPKRASGRLDVADELALDFGDEYDRVRSGLERPELLRQLGFAGRSLVGFEQHEARFVIEDALQCKKVSCVGRGRRPNRHHSIRPALGCGRPNGSRVAIVVLVVTVVARATLVASPASSEPVRRPSRLARDGVSDVEPSLTLAERVRGGDSFVRGRKALESTHATSPRQRDVHERSPRARHRYATRSVAHVRPRRRDCAAGSDSAPG
jgi:hypothetical protein